MEKVKAFGFSKLSNAYHISMHSSVYNLVRDFGAGSLGIADTLLTQYQTAIGAEQDLVNRAQGSDKTVVIRQCDTQRCSLYRYIYNVLSNMSNSPVEAIQTASATAQSKILSRYTLGMVSEADQKKTALMRGFVQDVDQFLADSIEPLALASSLEALTTANEAFQTAYLSRIEEQAADTVSTSQLRLSCEECYARVVATVNYHAALTDATDADTVALRTQSLAFIDALNTLHKRIRQSIKAGVTLSAEASTSTTTSASTGTSASTSTSGSTSGSSASSGIVDL